MAITKPNLTRIWAATAAGGDVVDPDVQTPGKFSLGWGAEKPPYQFFNFMQKLFTQGLGYFDEQGIGFWNTYTDYQDFSITKGSNGRLYLLKASGDGTGDPVDDAGTNWTQLPTRAEVDSKTEKPSETSVSGSTVFTQSNNNIALPSIGSIGLEIGDVVRVSGTADNNGLFTAEVLTDSGNIIFNQAHAGGTTSKSFVDETVSATVTLLSKWYNAPIGLGQGWVEVTASRSTAVNYTSIAGRSMEIIVSLVGSNSEVAALIISGVTLARRKYFDGDALARGSMTATSPPESTYRLNSVGLTIDIWSELR